MSNSPPQEDQASWRARWTEGRIGFHQSSINPHLDKHIARLEHRGRGRVLVPLAGKSRDMTWLSERFDTVVGVEFVEEACLAFFAEQDIPFQRRSAAGGAEVFEGGGVTLVRHDMLAVTRDHVGPCDAVWDRAALIALTPDQRQVYAQVLAGLLDPETPVLLVTLSYDEGAMEGPPFSVTPRQVTGLFGDDFTIEKLESQRSEDLPPVLAGHHARTSVWLLTRR